MAEVKPYSEKFEVRSSTFEVEELKTLGLQSTLYGSG